MKNVYIDTQESIWLYDFFKRDMVSIDEILDKCEDLILENQELKEELEDLKKNLHDNFKPIPVEEQNE